jgi:small conductance mechanosensitive channel
MRLQVDQQQLEDVCGEDPALACEQVLDWTGSEGLARFADWFIGQPVMIVLILLVAVVVNRLVRRGIRRLADRLAAGGEARLHRPRRRHKGVPAVLVSGKPSVRAAARAHTIGQVLGSVATAVIFVIAILMVLGELGVNLAPLIAGAGIAGVALGFGTQSLVQDFISGLFMLLEDQYGVGDVVDLGDAVGVVEEVTLRVTRLRDVNGTVWYVPNGQITRVANRSQEWSRAVLDVPVAYGTHVDQAEEIIKGVADELWQEEGWSERVLEAPEVWGVENLAAEAVTLRVVAKTVPSAQADVLRELRRRVLAAFEAEGIDMPSPLRALWRGQT